MLGSQLSDDGDYDTVAGLVIDECNRIPAVPARPSSSTTSSSACSRPNERRVQRLRVTVITTAKAEGSR